MMDLILTTQEKLAISYGSTHIMYSGVHAKIKQFADAISISPDDRVVIVAENRPGWAYAFYAIWVRHSIAVPIDYQSSAHDVAHIINDCSPRMVFATVATLPLVQEAMTALGTELPVVMIDDFETGESPFTGWIELRPDVNQTSALIYTSGTTGSPKGVMLTYGNIFTNLRAVVDEIPILTGEQTILMLLPLHHIFPLLGTLIASFYSGATIAISPSMASDDIIATLQNNQVTVIIGVPRLYAAIRKGIMDKVNAGAVPRFLFKTAHRINSPHFSKLIFGAVHKKFGGHLRFLVCGGAALSPEIASDFRTLGFDMLEGYGMTEAAPMITFTRPRKLVLGSPGQVVPFAQVAIVDGEIAVKGPNVMQGYWHRPDETSQVLRDGWLYTGDLGYIDQHNYLFVTGRKKEIIVLSNGKNINPAELEDKLMSLSESIKEVGVFQRGDLLHAIVVPELSMLSANDAADLDKYYKNQVFQSYNQQVAAYKRVLSFTVVQQELPKTRLGKVKRFQLEELAGVNPEPQPVAGELVGLSPELTLISQYIAREKGCHVRPGDHIEMDLGLDSLDKIGLQVFLENTFGVMLPPEQMVRFDSLLAMSDYVATHRSRMKAEKVDWASIIREKVNLSLPRTWVTAPLLTKLSKYFFSVYFRYRSKGLEHLPDGPCIIAPNHQSFFDGLFVTSNLGVKQVGQTYFYAKEKHVKGRLLKFFANRNNIIVMDLNKDLKQSIQKMAEVLRHKKKLVIFPEGTRSVNGTLGDFKKTFAILSRELNIPIVPVLISGAIDAMPKGSFFPRPFAKVSVEYLHPVYPENHTYESLSALVQDRIRQKLNKY
jgi:long-chain acyl-CoA synthetase